MSHPNQGGRCCINEIQVTENFSMMGCCRALQVSAIAQRINAAFARIEGIGTVHANISLPELPDG